jgi:hypothetical protein
MKTHFASASYSFSSAKVVTVDMFAASGVYLTESRPQTHNISPQKDADGALLNTADHDAIVLPFVPFRSTRQRLS